MELEELFERMLTADVHSEDDSAAEGLKEMDNITALHGDGSAQRQREEVEKAWEYFVEGVHHEVTVVDVVDSFETFGEHEEELGELEEGHQIAQADETIEDNLQMCREDEDRYLYILVREVTKFLTKAQVEAMFDDAEVISGGQRMAIDLKTYRNFKAKILQRLDIKEMNFCRCGLSVPDETTRCLNIECSIDIAKRSTYSDRKKVILAGVLPQLRAVLEKELPQILQHRRYHHENARSTETGYEFSESFAKNCETNREFAANIIRLSAIITADGFRYDGKGVKRAQVWPMTLALLDITAAKRFSLKNILTVGLFRGNEKPTLEEWNALSGHILDECRKFPITVECKGTVYQVYLKVTHGVMDFEAMRAAFRVRLYESGLCIWCDVVGERLNGAARYPCAKGCTKTADYHDFSSINAVNEYKEYALFAAVVNASGSIVDMLHVVCEGFLESIYRELETDLAATNKLRPKLRVQNGILEEVEKIGGRVKLPTYCSARLISLTAVANCSAKELLMASHLILPILCFEMYINDGLTASYTLALSCLIRALYMDGLKKDDLNDIAYALEALGSLWDEVYSKGTTTIKTHSFFAHLPEQLRKYGNVVDLDTSGFEHSYMEYKHLLNPHVTTNFDLYALQRIVLQRHAYFQLEKRISETKVPQFKKLYTQHCANRARGLRPEDTADPFVPEQRVNPPNTTSPAYPSYDALLRYVPFGNSVTLYSRAYKKGMTFASHYYWSGPKSTQQNLVAFESGGEICFGRIGAIAKLLPCDEVLVSVEKLGLADPKKLIFDYLDSSTQQSSDILKAVLTRYITGPACFCGEIAKDFNGFAIVPLDSIISTAAIIPLMNKNYYFAIPNKRCWQ